MTEYIKLAKVNKDDLNKKCEFSIGNANYIGQYLFTNYRSLHYKENHIPKKFDEQDCKFNVDRLTIKIPYEKIDLLRNLQQVKHEVGGVLLFNVNGVVDGFVLTSAGTTGSTYTPEGKIRFHTHPTENDRYFSPPSSTDLLSSLKADVLVNLIFEDKGIWLYKPTNKLIKLYTNHVKKNKNLIEKYLLYDVVINDFIFNNPDGTRISITKYQNHMKDIFGLNNGFEIMFYPYGEIRSLKIDVKPFDTPFDFTRQLLNEKGIIIKRELLKAHDYIKEQQYIKALNIFNRYGKYKEIEQIKNNVLEELKKTYHFLSELDNFDKKFSECDDKIIYSQGEINHKCIIDKKWYLLFKKISHKYPNKRDYKLTKHNLYKFMLKKKKELIGYKLMESKLCKKNETVDENNIRNTSMINKCYFNKRNQSIVASILTKKRLPTKKNIDYTNFLYDHGVFKKTTCELPGTNFNKKGYFNLDWDTLEKCFIVMNMAFTSKERKLIQSQMIHTTTFDDIIDMMINNKMRKVYTITDDRKIILNNYCKKFIKNDIYKGNCIVDDSIINYISILSSNLTYDQFMKSYKDELRAKLKKIFLINNDNDCKSINIYHPERQTCLVNIRTKLINQLQLELDGNSNVDSYFQLEGTVKTISDIINKKLVTYYLDLDTDFYIKKFIDNEMNYKDNVTDQDIENIRKIMTPALPTGITSFDDVSGGYKRYKIDYIQ
jgi:hypothetical protein